MRHRLAIAWLGFALVVLLVLEVPLGIQLARKERSTAINATAREASTLAIVGEEAAEAHDPERLAAIVQRDDEQGKRVVVVDPDGVARPGSDTALAAILKAPLAAAIRGTPASGSIRTPAGPVFYATSPIGGQPEGHGALAVVRPTTSVDGHIRRLRLGLAGIALATLLAAVTAGLVLARSVSRPLERLRAAAAAFGRGDLAARADVGRAPAEVAALAGTFNRMAEQLDELVSSQRTFVADASHQLRTPLTALRLRLEGSAIGREDPFLEAAIEETDRLTQLVDGLLALARADGHRQPRAAVDAAAVARERIAAWGPLAAERGVTLGSVLGPARALVAEGDLEQILDNLIDNALEVAPPGSAVTVRVQDAGDAVELAVRDRGPGLPADQLEHAFDRFWRGDPGRVGNGLGLAIVRQLALANGGGSELRRPEGGGIEAVVRVESARR